ncbi:OsmC family protein [Amphiplicatus metriothermophilus]|uniref:Organic hydroperoxide reductase OsmC/OhrA n=1 Tax=Amphiplicatus metriothermophilus TaxID=1519374 RepID=A0A239PM92_9PROT|nr:OsmC family protein [Amphiplicatus metriothermophilus]MBB5517441.1 organic hydroperoxide reductase OsmC/OhrA [Amphiplicatus metriothermophilus]SNT68224.1 Organic hydroperoxide reductase OsmC/OhrA [Amphiplicatus metriothermophilus]
MSEHVAEIVWRRRSESFAYEAYNRAHEWRFDGGVAVPASAAPAYRGEPERVDPEEAFVAAIASCHMLTFLAIAAKKRFVVDSYEDRAVGHMEKNEAGRLAIARVELAPRIAFAPGAAPDPETLRRMHHDAHENCFIANSVKTEIAVRHQD